MRAIMRIIDGDAYEQYGVENTAEVPVYFKLSNVTSAFLFD